jgi:hypothetical protein
LTISEPTLATGNVWVCVPVTGDDYLKDAGVGRIQTPADLIRAVTAVNDHA